VSSEAAARAGAEGLRAAALAPLGEADPSRKCALTHQRFAALRAGRLAVDATAHIVPPDEPGRPARPQLVAVRALAQRGLGTPAGRAAFIHAIAHIEFNAINLGWDAVARFPGMPEAFYRDWARVADDEARHFAMLAQRLAELGHAYGDFDAHNGLWEMAERTADDVLARMALVPRVLEARGLDVTPGMIHRLQQMGDQRTADILQVILDEEVEHVAIGTRWFHWCCAQRGVDPLPTFASLVERHARRSVRAPFNQPARRAAGFVDADFALLERLSAEASA
jgi:uncharacterized ferritin-like protein (DUF455 family)